MSDGRGPQLHQFGDRRLSAFSRQSSRLSAPFEPRSQVSTMILTPASSRRRSGQQTLAQGRSSFGYMGTTGVGTTPVLVRGASAARMAQLNTFGVPLRQDTRNPRNRVFLELLLKEVYDFCIANNFELEMGLRISPATFETPRQKDFVFLFKFLYGKLDPNYRFLALFDTDMKTILKNLSYPALEKVRDASSAAGEQNWPYNLAMLYWLVKLNLMLLNIDDDQSFNAPERTFDQIYNHSLFSSYAKFIDSIDDFTESDQVMEREFNNYKDEIYKAEQDKHASINVLLKENELLSTEYKRLEDAEDMTIRLKTDISSLGKYQNSLQDGFSSLDSKSVEFDSIILGLEKKIASIQEAKETYNTELHNKGLGIDQLNKLQDDQSKITRVIDSVVSKVNAAKGRNQELEDKIFQLALEIHDVVSQYNNSIQKISELASIENLLLNEKVTEERNRVFEVNDILSRSLAEEREAFLHLEAQINTERQSNDEEYLETLQKIEEVKQEMGELDDQCDTLEKTLAKKNDDYEYMREQINLEMQRFNAEIEKMEKDLQAMRKDMNLEIVKAKTLNTNLKRELLETRYLVKDKRENLLRTVQSDLNYVISFKDHIQKDLETLRLQTLKELEDQQSKVKESQEHP